MAEGPLPFDPAVHLLSRGSHLLQVVLSCGVWFSGLTFVGRGWGPPGGVFFVH